jgi:hypothetical protein
MLKVCFVHFMWNGHSTSRFLSWFVDFGLGRSRGLIKFWAFDQSKEHFLFSQYACNSSLDFTATTITRELFHSRNPNLEFIEDDVLLSQIRVQAPSLTGERGRFSSNDEILHEDTRIGVNE